MLQYRPLDGVIPDRMYYSPARDIANCGVELITAAISTLEEDINKGKFIFQDFTVEDLEKAVEKFGKALSAILEKTDEKALEESGFLDCDANIANLIYAYIGKMFVASVYVGVKDVHNQEDPIPLTVDKFVTLVKEYHRDTMSRTFTKELGKVWKTLKGLALNIARYVNELTDSAINLILGERPKNDSGS